MLCIPKPAKDLFRAAVKEGKINPDDLSIMTPEERHMMFEHLVGPENASTVNALFESKLLLKNQEKGFIDAINETLGNKPQVKRDLISKVQKMESLLNPAEKEQFMKDLASHKLGTEVTADEAAKISQISKEAAQARAAIQPGDKPGSAARLKYGAKLVEFNNYVGELKTQVKPLKEQLKSTLGAFKTKPSKAIGDLFVDIAGVAKGINAAFDNSVLFRQGLKTLITNPDTWATEAPRTFKNIWEQLGRKADDNTILDGLKSEILSRDNALNGFYDMAKIAIGNTEEAIPTTLPEKIPVLGRGYKAGEVAFSGFLYKTRADLFDKFVNKAINGGVELDKPTIEAIGALVNEMTGRGSLGVFEKNAKAFNNMFFSPRFLVSNLEFLTAHSFNKTSTPFTRSIARKNLAKAVGSIGAIMAIIHEINPDMAETDPRSADFGKIRVGNSHIDITAGMGSLITLAAREITQSSKSSTTHKITQLNTDKFGSQSGGDVAADFAANKLSPFATIVKETLLTHKTFEGEKPTFSGEVYKLFTPLPVQNAVELQKDPNSIGLIPGTATDFLGLATNTYSNKKK